MLLLLLMRLELNYELWNDFSFPFLLLWTLSSGTKSNSSLLPFMCFVPHTSHCRRSKLLKIWWKNEIKTFIIRTLLSLVDLSHLNIRLIFSNSCWKLIISSSYFRHNVSLCSLFVRAAPFVPGKDDDCGMSTSSDDRKLHVFTSQHIQWLDI